MPTIWRVGDACNDELRVTRLRPGQRLRVNVRAGKTLMCGAGRIRVAREADRSSVLLDAGQRFTFEAGGPAVVTALEGMRGEWLQDTGVALVIFPACLAAEAHETSSLPD